MTGFTTLLATVYVCDAMLSGGPLSKDDALRCAVAYETLKIGFLTAEERQAVQLIALSGGQAGLKGFEKFRTWERDRATLIEQFKDEARTIVQSMR